MLKEIAARRDGRKELTLVDTLLIEFHTGVYKVPTNLISLTPPLSIFQLDFLPQTFLQRGVSGVSPGIFFKEMGYLREHFWAFFSILAEG